MFKKNYLALISLYAIAIACLLPSQAIAQNEIRFEMAKTTHKDESKKDKPPYIKFLTSDIADVQVSGYVGDPIEQVDNKDRKWTYFITQVGATLVVKGTPTKIRVLAGYVDRTDLSKAPKSLKTFWMRGTKTKEFDLSGATEVVDLIIRNQNGLKEIDLSAQKKAKIIQLGRFGVGNQGWSLKKVIMPRPSVVEKLDISDTGVNDIDISNLPHLKVFAGSGTQLGEVVLNSPKIEAVEFSRAHLNKLEFKGATPNLHKVWLQDIFTITEIIIPNAPKLGNGSGNSLSTLNGLFFSGQAMNKLKHIKIHNSAITESNDFFAGQTPNLEDLDLTGAPIEDFNFTKFSKLRKIRMPIDNIKETDFDKIINTLPILQEGEKGYFEVAKTDATNSNKLEAFEQKLKAKGWNTKIPLAFEDLSNEEVKVFPTQTTDVVKIEGAKANTAYALFSMNGALCEKGRADHSGSAVLHLASYSKGVYIVKIGSKYQKVLLK